MHESSFEKMIAFRDKYLEGKENDPLLVLDLGSLDVNGSYRECFDVFSWTYCGIDTTPGKNVDIVLRNPYNWEQIKSNSADVLVSGQAFEHIEFFWITMLEIARVLKPGGICCIIAPSAGFEHKYPVDCWRFYPDGFAALARFARLEVLEVSTQWENDPRYADDSNMWHDTLLVCKKAPLSRFDGWQENIRRGLMHRILIWGITDDKATSRTKSFFSNSGNTGTDYDSWTYAQERDFNWYTVRMFKEEINDWIPLLDFFQNELDQQGKVVVEIGCGPTGGVLKFMKARLKIGIEPLANRFIEKGFENIASPDILFLNSFGEQIPLVNGYADVVCCIHSLGHVQKPQEVLMEVDRILKEGGEVFILEIMRTSMQVTIDHAVALQPEDFFNWFEENGYSKIRMDTTKTIQENEQRLPLFYGIFRKKKRPSMLSSVIDFNSDAYDNQISGGWYELEGRAPSFRWVANRFSAYVGISKDHKIFVIEGYAMLDHFPNNELCISFSVNDLSIGEHRLTSNGLFCLKMPLPQQFEDGKAKVRGFNNYFFIPDDVLGNGDRRELSFMIFRMGFFSNFESASTNDPIS